MTILMSMECSQEIVPDVPVSYGTPVRAMTGKYRARNPALVAALVLMDLSGRLYSNRTAASPTDRPLRVLIANWAHLGDVVITLPLLRFLAANPRVGAIGVLVGSSAYNIVANIPYIKNVHVLDHFFLNRSTESRASKMLSYLSRRGQVVREIADARYDVSIDLFAFFPSSHRLMWKAGIPMRVGFECTGLGSYLTNPVAWTNDDEYMLTKQLRLLKPVFGEEAPKTLSAAYPEFTLEPEASGGLTRKRPYVLMHLGSGDMRSWPTENWLNLGRELKAKGKELVFTGSKGREAVIAGEIAEKVGAQSVAGMQSWNQFVTSVANAAAVISVDTVTGHLAACFGIPSIILLSGRTPSQLVRPNNPSVRTLTHRVGCAPCYRTKGCAAMACVKLISVGDVLSLFNKIAGE